MVVPAVAAAATPQAISDFIAVFLIGKVALQYTDDFVLL